MSSRHADGAKSRAGLQIKDMGRSSRTTMQLSAGLMRSLWKMEDYLRCVVSCVYLATLYRMHILCNNEE